MSSQEVDDYMAGLPAQKQTRMRELRAWIKAAAPEAEEVITYKMPGFKLNGKFLVSYDAYKNHYSLFPASEGVEKALGTEIEPFVTGKGTISFTEEKPLTQAMVETIIKVRLKEVRGES
ncbi:MAG TPA: DUF1801 domain-containing protein [Candidatus Limnocylindrales bacterium]|nr:DUF1801 domain-containing protein [Candidatus Limnocylindrales bacterium]